MFELINGIQERPTWLGSAIYYLKVALFQEDLLTRVVISQCEAAKLPAALLCSFHVLEMTLAIDWS